MNPRRDWREIDDYEWQKCKACGALFTDPYMREVYEKKAAIHDDLFARGIRAEPPGSCPCCGGAKVKGIEKVGVADKRKLVVRSYWLDIVEWVKRIKRTPVQAS